MSVATVTAIANSVDLSLSMSFSQGGSGVDEQRLVVIEERDPRAGGGRGDERGDRHSDREQCGLELEHVGLQGLSRGAASGCDAIGRIRTESSEGGEETGRRRVPALP